MKYLTGWKSYVGAAGFLALAVFYYLNGQPEKAMEMVLAALGLLGLRHAISTAGVK